MEKSKALQRLRNVHNDLATVYLKDQENLASLRGSLRAYGGKDSLAQKELARRIAIHMEQIQALRSQVESDVATIKAKAVRKITASEKSMSDVRHMLAAGANEQQICQWILDTGRADGFQALREITTQLAYAQQSGTPGQRYPQQIVADAEKVIGSFEQRTFTPAEAAAAEEAKEVEMSINYLNRNFDQVESYFSQIGSDQGWKGNVRPVEQLSKWPGLPADNLLAGGSTLPLVTAQ